MARITITATGDYPYEVRQGTIDALTESIRLHMAAYGVKGVEVRQEVTTEKKGEVRP